MSHPKQPIDPPVLIGDSASGRFSYSDNTADDEQPLVCFHGLPGGLRDFRWLEPALPHRRVVRVNLPGFGQSPPAALSPAQLGRFVANVLISLNLNNVLLVGHSFGGVVATSGAIYAPKRVSGLVLLASVCLKAHKPIREVPSWSLLSHALRLPIIGPIALQKITAAFVQVGFSPQTPSAHIAACVHHLAKLNFAVHRAHIHALQVPTLLAWCEDDPLITAALFKSLDHALPDGPRLRFKSGGHALQKTQADAIAEAIQGWML